ncbi:MAG: hypothetical protein ACOCUW_02610 [Gemmatimonadota bacterium]
MSTRTTAVIDVPMGAQPDDFSCGPTSLQAVYAHFGTRLELATIREAVPVLEEGGTLAVHLGTDALRRGFRVRLHSYNLQVFDPSWQDYSMTELDVALAARAGARTDRKLRDSIDAYRTFLRAGGVVDFTELSPDLLHRYFGRGLPVLAGLSATYLYATPRERVAGGAMVFDDVAGDPQGHFVVLCGFDGPHVIVADPFKENPSGDHYYPVETARLIQAIMLGVLTYDGNLLILGRDGLP